MTKVRNRTIINQQVRFHTYGGHNMDKKISARIHRINYLNAELNALYHNASLKLGLTDSASIVLYTIYDNGENCLLSEIYKQSGISKQTVNSAIRNLEKEGVIFLEQHSGRAKKVVLTDLGKDYVQKTVARLFNAEAAAFSSWKEDEINAHIGFMEKYIDSFREQVKKL